MAVNVLANQLDPVDVNIEEFKLAIEDAVTTEAMMAKEYSENVKKVRPLMNS
jgi:hypothetical protein